MSKVSRNAPVQIAVHVEETTWVDVSFLSVTRMRRNLSLILNKGHVVPYNKQTASESETELDDKHATISSSTRLTTGPAKVYV